MPVGTQAAVKGLTIDQVRATGAQMILGNTYHLALRPGEEVIRELGGLHRFMGWDGPILTDSGGFQLFSLAQNTKVTEQAAVFRSHIDGSLLGAVARAGHRHSGGPRQRRGDGPRPRGRAARPTDDAIRDACERTIRWAERCQAAATRSDQAQFAIVQGGLDPELRVWCARQLAELDFPGYAVGGLSVGESPDEMYQRARRRSARRCPPTSRGT